MSRQNTIAIKCKKCGSPAYFDQKTEGFMCPYCGSFTPWTSANQRSVQSMVFRHRQVQTLGGLIKLIHLGQTETTVRDLRSPDEMAMRTSDLQDLLYEHDEETFKKWKEREEVSIDCPYCGAENIGFSTQSIFECEYCNNKMMPSEVFESGAYGENLVYGYGPNMYDLALPFNKTESIGQDPSLQFLISTFIALSIHAFLAIVLSVLSIYAGRTSGNFSPIFGIMTALLLVAISFVFTLVAMKGFDYLSIIFFYFRRRFK